MALTRTQVETVLVRRLGPGLERASMSVTTDGTNPDLADAITRSLADLEYNPPANILEPVDSDLSQIADADAHLFLLVAERNLILDIHGNLAHTDERMGPMGQWNSQYAKQLERRLGILDMRLERDYGLGLPQLSTGTLLVVSQQEE